MEVQLQEIIEKIKREGLDSAQKQSQDLQIAAEQEAKAIVARAQEEAALIRSKAREDAERFMESSKAALLQASRDLTLVVKGNLEGLFAKLLTESVKSTYSAKVVEDAIAELVKHWAQFPQGGHVQVSANLFEALKGKFKDLAGKNIEISASPAVTLGFRIQDGGAYYDFTADTVAKALSAYVNPAIAAVLRSEG
jgi:V/A-type H+/Na+-transporting ATPase subunit E